MLRKGEVVVTGCAGFIGSHVVDSLLSRGERVIGIDDFNDYYDPKIKERNASLFSGNDNFKLFRADIRDMSALSGIFENGNLDRIIHLAARAGIRASFENPGLYYEVNVEGTKNLLNLAVKKNVENFVFSSSSSVYGVNKKVPFSEDDEINNQVSPYAKTKKEGEILCKKFHEEHGLPITCLRFFTVYGPRGRPDMAPLKFMKKISNGEQIERYGDGKTTRDYTFVEDIVHGILSALDRPHKFEIINLGNGNPIDLRRFIKLIENNVGKEALIKELPEQKGDVPTTHADILKAGRLLGYEPKVSFEEGIKRMAEWYRKSEES